MGGLKYFGDVLDPQDVATKEYVDALQDALDDKAPLASPSLTGTPTSPTATALDDSTQIATTAHVKDVLEKLGMWGTFGDDANVTSTDWDDLVTEFPNSGWIPYRVSASVTATHAPSPSGEWYVLQNLYTDGEAIQVAYPSNSSSTQSYYRTRGSNGVWKYWERVITDRTLLGTVSQSGGIPTGAVIERGSNANGAYVKFADGTMICTGTYAWVNSGDAGVDITYPAEFASGTIPIVAMRCYPAGSTSILIGSANTPNNTMFDLTIYQITGTAGPIYRNAGYIQTWLAIGRWF